MSVSAKCADMFSANFKGLCYDDYVPGDIGIGSGCGDYVEFKYCLNCGQIQGEFPLEPDFDEDWHGN